MYLCVFVYVFFIKGLFVKGFLISSVYLKNTKCDLASVSVFLWFVYAICLLDLFVMGLFCKAGSRMDS